MSGGHFGYKQHEIADIINDIEQVIVNDTNPEYFGYDRYTEETLNVFKQAVRFLTLAHTYASRIDWLLSGDDSEETFHKRLTNDIRALKANFEEIE
jgi:hypothetical protein